MIIPSIWKNKKCSKPPTRICTRCMAANQSELGHLVCLQQKLLVITRLNEVHTAIQCYISYAIVSHNFNFWFRLLLRFKHAYFLTNPALLQQLQPFHTKTPQVPLCGSACMLPHGAHGTPTFSFKTFSRLLKPSARQYLGHKLSLQSDPFRLFRGVTATNKILP